MSKHQDGYILPLVVDPPRLCAVVNVPDDQYHILAFLGQMSALGYWYNWQRDSAKTGKAVAKVWRDVYDHITFVDCNLLTPKGPGIEAELAMPIHVDCDCKVTIDCCDGSEKQLVTLDMLNDTALGNGVSKQPAAGGGNAVNCKRVFANGATLLDIPVSTGDIITLQSSTGATNDPSGPNPLLWFCADGGQYFGGECTGSTSSLVGTDPLPTAKHLALLLNIAGTYFDLSSGPVTVPGGVSAVQPTLQINDNTLSDDNGFLDVCINVQNNQVPTWTQTFDFTSSPYSTDWAVDVDGAYAPSALGQWVAGVGYSEQYVVNAGLGTGQRLLQIESTKHANILNIQIYPTCVVGDFTGEAGAYTLELLVNGVNVLSIAEPATPPTVASYSPGGLVTDIILLLRGGYHNTTSDPGGSAKLPKIVITGTGVNPY